VKDARVYVELAERQGGLVPRPVPYHYIWGDALEALAEPDLRLVNLETAVTTSDEWWRGKGIHYRMSPRNLPCLRAAGIDGCVLANNHVLDWGYGGLEETLRTLHEAGIRTAGAGLNRYQARRPAVFHLPGRARLLLFAAGSTSSGIPPRWEATIHRPGVHMVDESSPDAAEELLSLVEEWARPHDLVVVSLHWGPNWDTRFPEPSVPWLTAWWTRVGSMSSTGTPRTTSRPWRSGTDA
jgi:poly-gamma-glutamate synthesis protein (capsule biosynthesis protein)